MMKYQAVVSLMIRFGLSIRFRTIGFWVLCHFGFDISSKHLFYYYHYYSTFFVSFKDRKSPYQDFRSGRFFRRPAELSPTELINKIIKIPKHIPDYDKSEFRSRQHVMTVPPYLETPTRKTYIFLSISRAQLDIIDKNQA